MPQDPSYNPSGSHDQVWARMVGATGPAPSGGATDPMYVASANPATVYTAQQTTTAGAVALAAQALVNGIVITALSTNAASCAVGPSGVSLTTGYLLAPGQSISFGVTNASAVFLIGANTTDKINIAGN